MENKMTNKEMSKEEKFLKKLEELSLELDEIGAGILAKVPNETTKQGGPALLSNWKRINNLKVDIEGILRTRKI